MKPKPKIEEILRSLGDEVLYGRAYLTIFKGLAAADPVLLNTANVFFGLTMEAAIQTAQMFAAKLFDTTKHAITVNSLLFAAENQVGSFKNGTPLEVVTAIAEARNKITKLQPILAAIRRRRNEALAHLDSAAVTNPQALAVTAKLTVADLDKVFEETGHVLNEIHVLYDGVASDFQLIGGGDYDWVLKLIADAKNAQADNYEKEFREKAPFPRPRKR